MTVNVFKLVFASLTVTLAFVSLILGDLDPSAGWALIGTVCGYVLGNGVNARNGSDIPGIIRPRPAGRRAQDDPLPD